jgi:N-methylhydantoinase B
VNGEPIRTQARVTLKPGDVVRLDLPGGGGYGEAAAGAAAS